MKKYLFFLVALLCLLAVQGDAGPPVTCLFATTTQAGCVKIDGTTVTINPSGVISAAGGGSGNVTGPAGATANDLASYNGTTGLIIKDSGILTSNVQLISGLASPAAIGNTTPNSGAFTTLSATSTVSGAGFTSLFASPPAIGGTAAAGGAFTTLSASGSVTGTGFSNLFTNVLLANTGFGGITLNSLGAGAALGGTEQIPMFQTANPALTTTPRALATYMPTQFNTIDATQSAGADMCAKISTAANSLHTINATGGTIDARGFSGTQACAGSMFASWPGSGFAVLLGNVLIQTQVQQAVPNKTSLLGVLPYANAQDNTGAVIQWANTNPSITHTTTAATASGKVLTFTNTSGVHVGDAVSGTNIPDSVIVDSLVANTSVNLTEAVVSTGVANGATITFTPALVSLGGVSGSQFYSRVENVAANCVPPNGTMPVGAIGFQNITAQEGSWFRGTYAGICQIAYDFEDTAGAGGGGSPQNGGPYILLNNQTPAVTTNLNLTTFHAIKIGNSTNLSQLQATFEKLSVAGTTSTTACVTIDGTNVATLGSHFENCLDAFLLGSRKNAHALELLNDQCGTGVLNNCVHLSATGGADGVFIQGMQDPISTNIIQDDQTNGCTITGAEINSSFGGATYLRSGNNLTWSPDGACASTIAIYSTRGGTIPGAPTSCGTSPSMVAGSTNNQGSVTTGTGTPTTCTINFSTPIFKNAPNCMVVPQTTGVGLVTWSTTTGTLVITNGTGTSSAKYSYHCE